MFFLKKIGRLQVDKRDIEWYGKRRKQAGTGNERKMVIEGRLIQTWQMSCKR